MFRKNSRLYGLRFAKPKELFHLVLTSFVPRMRRTSIDLVGPFIALVLLIGIVHYGHAYKLPSAAIELSPFFAIIGYSVAMPLLTYTLVRCSQGCINFFEAVTLIGYGLFGHVLTLIVSFAIGREESNVVFFCCMVMLGGLSALRVAISLLIMVPRPAARLVVCSVVATLQLLSLLFLHFAYMHRTFKYGHRS